LTEDIRKRIEEISYRAKAALPTVSAGLTARDNILLDLQLKLYKMQITTRRQVVERGEVSAWLQASCGGMGEVHQTRALAQAIPH